MSEPNEAVERLQKLCGAESLPLSIQMREWDRLNRPSSASHYADAVAKLEAEREILLRKAAAFDAMAEHRWIVSLSIDGAEWRVWKSDRIYGEGANPLEAVEAAVKGLEGR